MQERFYRGRRAYWNCVCRCGTVRDVLEFSLQTDESRRGSRSCGCLARELSRGRARHGMHERPEYQTWADITQRCENKEHSYYPHYGGRGIYLDERWRVFENFIEDMGPRPAGHSIERLNNNGPYAPGNCVWATPKMQGNNRRSSVFLEFRGEKKTIAQWVEELGIGRSAVQWRLKVGWSVEEALTTPSQVRRK